MADTTVGGNVLKMALIVGSSTRMNLLTQIH